MSYSYSREVARIPPDLKATMRDERPSLFAREYGETSRNFVTPDIMGWWARERVAIELSLGEGILDESTCLYGVSVVVVEDNKTKRIGRMAHSLEEAVELIRFTLENREMPPV